MLEWLGVFRFDGCVSDLASLEILELNSLVWSCVSTFFSLHFRFPYCEGNLLAGYVVILVQAGFYLDESAIRPNLSFRSFVCLYVGRG